MKLALLSIFRAAFCVATTGETVIVSSEVMSTQRTGPSLAKVNCDVTFVPSFAPSCQLVNMYGPSQ